MLGNTRFINKNNELIILFCTERIEVGFSPVEYDVTEGETAMLRVELSMAFDEEVTVSLQTSDGSAQGMQTNLFINTEPTCSRDSLCLHCFCFFYTLVHTIF